MRKTTRRPTAAALLLAAACAGCSTFPPPNPLGSLAADYGERVPVERLRTVDRFQAERFTRPPTTEEDAPPVKPVSRLATLAEVTMTLEEARASALENNLELSVALVNPAIQAQALRAEEAKFEAVFTPSIFYSETDSPTLNRTDPNQQDAWRLGAGVSVPLRTGGRASVNFVESFSQTDNPFFTLNSSYTSGLNFSLSQPLLRGAGRRANTYSIRIASYQRQISEAQTKLEVIRQVAAADRAYWRLYAARRELEVRQQQFELARTQLERARRLVDAGQVAEIEVLRAEEGVASRLEAIINAENQVLQQQREFKRIVNAPGLEIDSRTIVVPGTDPDPLRFEFDPASLTEQAVANRMEMLELELQLAADFSTIEFNKNQALPLFSLDYRYSIDGLGPTHAESFSTLRGNDFESWSLGLSGEIPIGNEAARARVQQAILQRLQRLSTRDARRQAIIQEVLNAIDNIEAGWQRILAARQAAITAGRTLEAERRQFEVGVRTSTEVLDAAARLADAQSAEIRAIADYQIAQVDLAFATGTTLGAARIDWQPLDESDQPGADPTPPPFPFYADPAKARR